MSLTCQKQSVRDIAARLERGNVHVWTIWINMLAPDIEKAEAMCASDERARAMRFHFYEDRARFIGGRSCLRQLLGPYTGLPSRDVRFSYNEYGKPSLDVSCGPGWLRFNYSQSEDLALVAVASGQEVGVDIEYVRPSFATERTAEQFFAPGEIAALKHTPEHLRPDAFFRCWTQKEAFVKGIGQGLSLPLDAFEVGVTEKAAGLVRCTFNREAANCWSLYSFRPAPAYMAALAIQGAVRSVEHYVFTLQNL